MGDCEGVGGLASKGAERWGFWGPKVGGRCPLLWR